MTDPMTDTPLLQRTTAAVIDRHVAERPDKVAIVELDGRSLSYRELQGEAFRIANSLSAMGVPRQGNVMYMMGNSVDCAVTWLAITLGGMVAVPVNTAFKGESLRYIIDMSQATVIVIDDTFLPRLEEVIDQLAAVTTVVVRGDTDATNVGAARVIAFESLLDAPADRPEPPQVWDLNAIMFTSGTTGPSKGVMTPHGHAFTMASHPPLTSPDEVSLVTLPLFHNAGLLAGVYNPWRVGGTAVLVGAFSASQFWEQVRQFGCTTTILLGAQIEFLWRQPPTPADRAHTLREAIAVPIPAFAAEFTERFGVALQAGYGLSEAGTFLVGVPGDTRPANCGFPRSYVEVRLVDEHGVEVAPGEIGEIVMRTSEPWSSMSGYYRMPEETVKAWQNLWLHSGDVAYQEPDGTYVFVDRRKDALRRRGENVSSFEVEAHIQARDDIAEVAVVAVPSDHSEDELKAVIVLATGASFEPEKILADLAERMPYFMVPRYLEVAEALPKTPTHKVQKAEIRKWGNTNVTWDCEAAGWRITRDGLVRLAVNA